MIVLPSALLAKKALLEDIVLQYQKVAIAFSGGVDSSLLLKIAFDLMPGRVAAFFADSIVQPRGEKEHAVAIAGDIGIALNIVAFDVLANPEITLNSSERCYFCKRTIFNDFLIHAGQHDISVLLDGTNLDDNLADRPGAKACQELAVKSPLRAAGFTKKDIRQLSRQLGMANWHKPSASCLATRIPTGVKITPDRLAFIDAGEHFLQSLGFMGCRLRVDGTKAFVELIHGDIEKACDGKLSAIREHFSYLGISKVYLDLSERDVISKK